MTKNGGNDHVIVFVGWEAHAETVEVGSLLPNIFRHAGIHTQMYFGIGHAHIALGVKDHPRHLVIGRFAGLRITTTDCNGLASITVNADGFPVRTIDLIVELHEERF